MKMLNGGYTPAILHEAVHSNYSTPVLRAGRVDYKWSKPSGEMDHDLWKNVELVRIILKHIFVV